MQKQQLILISFVIALFCHAIHAQDKNETITLKGTVFNNNTPLPFANVYLKGTSFGTSTNKKGEFTLSNIPLNAYKIIVSFTGFKTLQKKVTIKKENNSLRLNLEKDDMLDEIVISGTLKPVVRSESPVPVETYKPTFFKKNPTASVFEALQNVNGVRPQINCSICNTGDIHINGLEGPYTLVMIDGMPIVSGLSTVYGLSGIPNSLINRIEIIKGPASSLYGSEAVGGLINIITKNPESAAKLSADAFVTGWGETNVDLGVRGNYKHASTIFGANYFLYDQIIDNDNDGFTDLTLQNRISLFNKWNIKRKDNKVFSLAARFYYEDRWGGQTNWNKSYRGGDQVYGESIYTTRYELLGNYELPVKESINLSFSLTDHDQNSFYGTTNYQAQQTIGFSQLTWDKTIKKHEFLLGLAVRHQFYDDNTPATQQLELNDPEKTTIPGVFIQDEIKLAKTHKLLLGSRLDFDSRHGPIFTPRLAYKWNPTKNNIFRLNAGTGFRVVNLFTEDHAALTGSREVIIEEDLDPEKSFNINLNYLKKIYLETGAFVTIDMSTWYTYFTNAIIPDYETNVNEIRYRNLNGHAISKGISLNTDLNFSNGLKFITGMSLMDVSNTNNGVLSRQILTENFTANWGITYSIPSINLSFDYTGNLFSPMKLPVLGTDDPRKANSPWFSIQNIQATYKHKKNLEVYGGVKNLLNWTPSKNNPYLIAGADDPFGPDFDATYIYASNQGIRGFLGIRYNLF